MAEFTVAASVVRGLLEFAVSRGASEAALAKRSGIDPCDLEDPDRRIASPNYVALMKAGQALSGDPALALHFAEAINLSRMSIVGLLGQASQTLLESFKQTQRYGQLVTDMGAKGRFTLGPVDGGLWGVDHRPNPNTFPEHTETTFGFMVCGARIVGPSRWLKEVHVTHKAPSYRKEYERIFEAPVTFESHWNALRIDPLFLTHPVNVQPRYVFGILSQHADDLLKSLESSKTMRGRVESLLMPVLHTGDASMAGVAAKLGLSRPTLSRRLKAEGVTFEKVLDDLRRMLALHYLSGKRVSVNEVAFLVGFSDATAFSRAFKRWTGTSPRGIRAEPESTAGSYLV